MLNSRRIALSFQVVPTARPSASTSTWATCPSRSAKSHCRFPTCVAVPVPGVHLARRRPCSQRLHVLRFAVSAPRERERERVSLSKRPKNRPSRPARPCAVAECLGRREQLLLAVFCCGGGGGWFHGFRLCLSHGCSCKYKLRYSVKLQIVYSRSAAVRYRSVRAYRLSLSLSLFLSFSYSTIFPLFEGKAHRLSAIRKRERKPTALTARSLKPSLPRFREHGRDALLPLSALCCTVQPLRPAI